MLRRYYEEGHLVESSGSATGVCVNGHRFPITSGRSYGHSYWEAQETGLQECPECTGDLREIEEEVF